MALLNRALAITALVSLTLYITVYAAPHVGSARIENKKEGAENELERVKVLKLNARSNYDEKEKVNIITRVIGKKVHVTDYPYAAAVIMRTSQIGSGVIINKQWILTSAWVTLYEDPATTLIRVGSDLAIDKGQTSWASKLIPHPKYKHTWEYDLSLIKLKKPLKFNKKVKAIKFETGTPSNGTKADVIGYGYTNRESLGEEKKNIHNSYTHDGWLHATSTQVLPYKDCKEYYSYYTSFTNSSLCSVPKNETGPCTYDYGGPLVADKKLIGIFSGVPVCTSSSYPPVYTDVVKCHDWISETIQKNSDPSELEDYENDILYYE